MTGNHVDCPLCHGTFWPPCDKHRPMVGPHDARTEHHTPEQSNALLQAELNACRQEIARLRTSLAQANRTITDLQEHR